MTQLMQHRIDHLLERQEQARVVMISESQTDLPAFVHIQTEQILLRRQELGENLDVPGMFLHDGFDDRGDFAQHLEGGIWTFEVGKMFVGAEEGGVFF
jgi:hypothetical protein